MLKNQFQLHLGSYISECDMPHERIGYASDDITKINLDAVVHMASAGLVANALVAFPPASPTNIALGGLALMFGFASAYKATKIQDYKSELRAEARDVVEGMKHIASKVGLSDATPEPSYKNVMIQANGNLAKMGKVAPMSNSNVVKRVGCAYLGLVFASSVYNLGPDVIKENVDNMANSIIQSVSQPFSPRK